MILFAIPPLLDIDMQFISLQECRYHLSYVPTLNIEPVYTCLLFKAAGDMAKVGFSKAMSAGWITLGKPWLTSLASAKRLSFMK